MIGKLNFIRNDSIKILMIDNAQENLDNVAQILNENGYDVTTAESGARGVALSKRLPPDLILLDVTISDMNGYDICRRIKSDPKTKDIPLIFLTEKTCNENLLKCFEAGAVDYISVPFIRDELIARVRVHTELAIKGRHERMLAETLDKYAMEIIIDTQGKIKYVSSAFLRLTEFETEELVGQSFDFLKHPDSFRSILPDILDSVMNKFTYYKEIDLRTRNNERFIVNTFAEPLKTRNGEVKGAQCFMSDVTSKKELERLSITDKLTGLNNRHKLGQVLGYEFSQFQRYATGFSVILMDMDNFKKINDTYGYISGDRLLVNLAEILKANVRDSDTCGRWGGEEFLIILPKANEEEAVHVAEKLRKNIETGDFSIEKNVTASFGVANIETDSNITKLLSNADKALYKAKKSGKNMVVKASDILKHVSE